MRVSSSVPHPSHQYQYRHGIGRPVSGQPQTGTPVAMSQRIDVSSHAPHEWSVTVTEGDVTTHHRVIVPEDLLTDLGLAGADEQQVVHQTFEFLLDKEPATSIYEEFPLDVVLDNFPDYAEDLRTRMAA
jgi:hypothetical protein